ncbi:uncharacterized protein LOC119432677 [Dermacentor silvarum]|uniref:uncharacterized protein LOC119432677 n=1 Tax=Dermacentor silvarum TaxID=543639 RepID=UPI00189B84E7|nr:uncharacterized protein LOC119432677 [Dermacentor silvarum]
MMYQGPVYARDRQYRVHRCHWEKVYVYDDTLWVDRHLILRHHRMRRSLLFLLTTVIVLVPFMLGCLLYRIRGFEDVNQLFGFGKPVESTNAYNDRAGREVAPHARWVERGHRWQTPQRGLRLFSAHYRHELGSLSKPTIRIIALATTEFLDTCLVQARVVYRDYPNSFPTEPVVCRRLSHSSEQAEPSASVIHDVVLELATGQPDDRVPVALSIQTSQDPQSAVWIAVNTSFVEPFRDMDSVAICLRVNGASSEHVTELAEWYRSRGARQVTVYGVATRTTSTEFKAPSLRGEFVSWYDPEMLVGVSDATAKSLMLRDCALRSSATSKCVAFLGADERLVVEPLGSWAKCCLRDQRLLRKCGNSWTVFVERRDDNELLSAGEGSSCEGSASEPTPHHRSPTTLYRRCVNGTMREAVLFRVDDGLLDGSTVVDKNANFLPPSIAVLRPFVATKPSSGQRNTSKVREASAWL